MKLLKRERLEIVFDRTGIWGREDNISYNESNYIWEVYLMVMFVLLLIALVVGAVAIVSIGGIGIGLAVVGFGDVIIGIIILLLLGKNRNKGTRD